MLRTRITSVDNDADLQIKRLNKNQKQVRMHDVLEIYDGEVRIFRTTHSGDVWQLRMWISQEKKYIRKSLKTRDKLIAIEIAKAEYIKYKARLLNGEKLFSLTASDLRNKYLEHVTELVEGGQISAGRLTNIKTYTKHYQDFVGKEAKIQNIAEDFFDGYRAFRQTKVKSITMTVVVNESITIKQMYKWAVKKKLISSTYVPDFGRIKVPKNETRRESFTVINYDKLVNVAKKWWQRTPKGSEKRDEEIYYRRSIRDFILLMANFGFRTGELLQLKFGNVKVHNDATEHSSESATVKVLAETSKVRKERTVRSRRGDIFNRRKTYSRFFGENSFVFSMYGEDKMMTTTILYDYFTDLKKEVKKKYPDYDDSLSLYSLRHFWITLQLIHGKVDIHKVARFAGTSYTQIVNHYDGMKDAEVSNQLMAVKLRFDVENDGIYVMQDKAKDEDEGDKEDGKIKETA
jgi:integrase